MSYSVTVEILFAYVLVHVYTCIHRHYMYVYTCTCIYLCMYSARTHGHTICNVDAFYPVYWQLEALDLVLVGVNVHSVGREGLEEFIA